MISIGNYFIQQKKQPIYIWLFLVFLLIFPLTVRKVIWYKPIMGEFNEYSAMYLYASDILIALMIGFWLLSILHNKCIILSSKLPSLSPYKNVPRGTFSYITSKWHILIPLTLVIWSLLSAFWSSDVHLSLFRSIKLAEYLAVYFFIIYAIVPRGTFLMSTVFLSLIATGTIHSLLAISQFIYQQSLGLRLLQESLISPVIPGVAKIVINNYVYIRAYGLFPHPNILAGYLLLTILVSAFYLKLFHVEQLSVPQLADRKYSKIVPRGTILIELCLFLQIIAFLLTFSKTAFVALAVSAVYYFFSTNASNLKNRLANCSTWNNFNRRHIITGVIVILLATIGITQVFYRINYDYFLSASIKERIEYLNVSRGTISQNLLLGIGSGQSIYEIGKMANHPVEFWQYQPVHNVFLLIWSELGLIGLLLFMSFLYKLFHVEQFSQPNSRRILLLSRISNCSTWNNLSDTNEKTTITTNQKTVVANGNLYIISHTILVGFLFIMLFDHYLWDIQQGSLLLWITLGLTVASQFDN